MVNLEKYDSYALLVGIGSGADTLKSNLAGSQNIKYKITMWSSHSACKRPIDNPDQHKNLKV